MMDLKEISEALNRYVRPQTDPVAIRMCETSEEFPAKVRLPKRDLGLSVTLCQGISMVRRYGWTLAIGKDDQSCPHGAVAVGFVSTEGYLDGSYAESVGLGPKEPFVRSVEALSRLEYGKYSYMLAAPLDKAAFQPHLIVIYGNPAQVSRLVQGAVAKTGGVLTATAGGGVACAGIISRTMLTDQCQYVLAGAGDRYFALTQDHELAFAMPMSKAESTISGLEIGQKSGHRYPTPSYLMFEGQLPPAYDKLLELLKGNSK